VTNPKIIDQIQELILEDHRISGKSIAEQLGISRERVWKCLNADQKRQQCQSSEQLLEYFQRDPNDFLS
jgi:DNA-binding CsgD family transcriptional regulator